MISLGENAAHIYMRENNIATGTRGLSDSARERFFPVPL